MGKILVAPSWLESVGVPPDIFSHQLVDCSQGYVRASERPCWSYWPCFTLGAPAQCQSTIIAGHKCQHTVFSRTYPRIRRARLRYKCVSVANAHAFVPPEELYPQITALRTHNSLAHSHIVGRGEMPKNQCTDSSCNCSHETVILHIHCIHHDYAKWAPSRLNDCERVHILGTQCLNTAPLCAGAQALVLGHQVWTWPKSDEVNGPQASQSLSVSAPVKSIHAHITGLSGLGEGEHVERTKWVGLAEYGACVSFPLDSTGFIVLLLKTNEQANEKRQKKNKKINKAPWTWMAPENCRVACSSP